TGYATELKTAKPNITAEELTSKYHEARVEYYKLLREKQIELGTLQRDEEEGDAGAEDADRQKRLATQKRKQNYDWGYEHTLIENEIENKKLDQKLLD